MVAVREDLANLRQDVATLTAHVQRQDAATGQLQDQVTQGQQSLEHLVPLTARLARLEAAQAPPSRSRNGKQAPRPQAPADLVRVAQQEAQVVPTSACYFAKSGECTFTWMPGRIYTVLLTWNHQTLISLPPAETLVIGMMLDEKSFDVVSKLVGSDLMAYTTVSIRPLIEKGEVDAAIVSQSGRRYLFHFVLGEKGMVGVNFETPKMHEESPEKKLILPRPPA
jgi:hypothetical protein